MDKGFPERESAKKNRTAAEKLQVLFFYDVRFLFFCFGAFDFAQIVMGQHGIRADQQKNQHVQIDEPVPAPGSADKFAGETADVSGQNHVKERETFSLRVFDPECFQNLCRPAGSEHEKHHGFQNFCKFHGNKTLPFLLFDILFFLCAILYYMVFTIQNCM